MMTNRKMSVMIVFAVAMLMAVGTMANGRENPCDVPTPGFVFDGNTQTITDDGAPVIGKYPCEPDLIEVMFESAARVRLRENGLVDLSGRNALSGVDQVLSKTGSVQWTRGCTAPEADLDRVHQQAEANSGQVQYNLNNIFRVKIDPQSDIWEICRELEKLSGIQQARPVPLPVRPPTPDYEGYQLHLNGSGSSIPGVGAFWAWDEPGGAGEGVTVCDIEYGWNMDHADITQLPGSGVKPSCGPPEYVDHGTAVAGILCADNNGWGTTGICYGATLKTSCAIDLNGTWNVPAAMSWAIVSLMSGDVILLEQQWDYNGGDIYDGLIPVEWWTDSYPSGQSDNAVRAAIRQAVALGIHVVEAAGNSNVNLNTLTWLSDSGAIIVGAGGVSAGGTCPESEQQRLPFSNYGSRVNVQAHGEDVVTTGSGDLYDLEGEDYYFTSLFRGTSSASAIIAGVVACVSGYVQQSLDSDPSFMQPLVMREMIRFGATPQVIPPEGHIGGLPDLAAIFSAFSPSGGYGCTHNGDVNNDFWVTAADARLAFMIALGTYGPDEEETCAADCNDDGSVSASDAQGIFDSVLGRGNCTEGGYEFIPPGLLGMGSPTTELCRYYDENRHLVVLTTGFYMKTTEVTQEEWDDIFFINLSSYLGYNRPVETISWFDAVIYCNRLSVREGYRPCYYSDSGFSSIFIGVPPVTSGTVYWDRSANGYRLPTEAEWEFACRAGTTTSLNNGTNVTVCSDSADPNMNLLGRYYYNGGQYGFHAEVGSYLPNDWGLYDMHGNVWEWCWDWYGDYPTSAVTDPTGPSSGSYRVVRGGSWSDYARRCRSARRSSYSPGYRYYDLGFRPVRSLD